MATSRLAEAKAAAEQAKSAAEAADANTQSKQEQYAEATAARDAAKAAYDVALQELRAVEQAARNASALLVKYSETAMAAEAKLDGKQLAAAEANRKVGPSTVTLLNAAREMHSSSCPLGVAAVALFFGVCGAVHIHLLLVILTHTHYTHAGG